MKDPTIYLIVKFDVKTTSDQSHSVYTQLVLSESGVHPIITCQPRCDRCKLVRGPQRAFCHIFILDHFHVSRRPGQCHDWRLAIIRRKHKAVAVTSKTFNYSSPCLYLRLQCLAIYFLIFNSSTLLRVLKIPCQRCTTSNIQH